MEEKWWSIKIYELFSFVDSFVHAAACEIRPSRGDTSMVIDRRIKKRKRKKNWNVFPRRYIDVARKKKIVSILGRNLPVENVSAIFTRVISGINVLGRCCEQQRHRYRVLQFLSTSLQPADILIWQDMTCFDCKHRLYDAFVPRS